MESEKLGAVATEAVALRFARLRAALEDPAIPYQGIVTWLTVGVFAFETYVKIRQIPHLKLKAPPKELATYLDANEKEATNGQVDKLQETKGEGFQKAQAYALDKLKFSLFANAVDLVETLLFFTSFLAPYFAPSFASRWSALSGLWSLAERWSAAWAARAPAWAHWGTGEIPTSLMFLILFTAIRTVTAIPADLWKQFVLEEKHGFNKQTLRLWILDQVKATALSGVLGLPITAALIAIVRWAGEAFVQWTMLFIVALVLFMYVAGPYLIMPLFNKFRHLDEFPEHKEVVDRTQALAKRISFPLKRLWVIDGSKRSSHSNAFFFGLPGLTKHIVLYDTLLKQATPEQVEAILAHELGHWRLYHTLLLFFSSMCNIAVTLSIFRFFLWNPALFSSFGFSPLSTPSPSAHDFLTSAAPRPDFPIIIGFILASDLLGPLNTIVTFAVHALSRVLEFQADDYAKSLGYAGSLKWALVKISVENKATTSNDWLFSMLHHSHPTLLERVAALERKSKDD